MKRHRQSWEAEHEEFRQLAAEIRPGEKWTLGFYQVIPDIKPPTTKLKDNSFLEFLIPEDYLSLKLFFDNLRNYGICAAFVALGAWIWLNSHTLIPQNIPIWLPKTVAIATWTMVGCLLILNSIQTWNLTIELYQSLRAIRVSKTRIYRGGTFAQAALSFGHMTVSWFADVFISIFVLLTGASVIAISIGFVAYAVLSRQILQ